MNLWIIFLTGLTVGGVSCMAVQGGLLASTIAAREEEDVRARLRHKHNIRPTLVFLATKFIAYVILGFILGSFGSVLALSDSVRVFMQIAASVYMLLVAMNLLNIHPIFRYVIIQHPRFLTKLVRNQSKSKEIFAPAFLGALTIFIPCGTTLAMEALAISSGSPYLGAAIMGAFILGTTPLFFGLGFLTTILGDAFRTRFLKIAAIGLLYLGITSFNGALALTGLSVSLDLSGESFSESNIKEIAGAQVANIEVLPNGYNPNYIKVKSGIPVKLNLTPVGGLGCTSGFVIPSLGIRKNLTQGTTTVVEFTPTAKGKISWSCSMGMYRGTIEVI